MDAKQLERRLKIVSTTLAVVFLAAGLSKWAQLSMQVELFRQFGFPRWSMLLVGTLEIGFAALLLSSATRHYGAMGVALLMIGAVFTHVLTGVMIPMLAVNALLLLPSIWVVMKQRPTFLSPRRVA